MSHNDHIPQRTLRDYRERRRCGCPNLEHYHGCRNRYDQGCHCQTCREAVSAMRREQRGKPPGVTAAEQEYVRDEIAWFLTWNMTDERIADRVGVPVHAVERVRVLARKAAS